MPWGLNSVHCQRVDNVGIVIAGIVIVVSDVCEIWSRSRQMFSLFTRATPSRAVRIFYAQQYPGTIRLRPRAIYEINDIVIRLNHCEESSIYQE